MASRSATSAMDSSPGRRSTPSASRCTCGLTASRARLAVSPHVHREADGVDRRPGELSIAEVADRLAITPDVVYYWASRGYLPTRRGQAGRRWIDLTPELEAACHARIAGSYKLTEDVKAAHHTEEIAV